MKGGPAGGSEAAAGDAKDSGGGIGSRRDRAVWLSPDPSPEIVAELSRCFPSVVSFPEEEVSAEARSWAASGVVAKCFGRGFQPEALVREFRWRGRFRGEIKAFGLDKGFYLVKFSLPEEREKVLGVPWVVNGQVVAVEPWRPAFIPRDGAITHALVWLRLPQLPVEYWGEAAIRRLVSEAGEFVGLDECTAAKNRLGFARASVKLDLRQPLRPGTLMMAGEDLLWQRFAYENLGDLCLQCGMLHPAEAQCQKPAAGAGVADGADETGTGGAGPKLGPWVLAVRSRPPANGGGDGSSRLPAVPAKDRGSAPVRGGGGWMKPSRVARRPPPGRPSPVATGDKGGSERGKMGAGGGGNPFSALLLDGRGGSGGGSLCPPGLAKRARPNEVVGSPSLAQATSSRKLGPVGVLARSRKIGPNRVKGKEVAPGQVQSTSVTGRGTADTGVFMFSASDSGGSGLTVCPTPSLAECQLSVEQAVDPMLVYVQDVPGSATCGVSQSGDQPVEAGIQDIPRESPGPGHDLAVARMRQAILEDGEGLPEGRKGAVASVDEDLMCGDEDAVQFPHPGSS